MATTTSLCGEIVGAGSPDANPSITISDRRSNGVEPGMQLVREPMHFLGQAGVRLEEYPYPLEKNLLELIGVRDRTWSDVLSGLDRLEPRIGEAAWVEINENPGPSAGRVR